MPSTSDFRLSPGIARGICTALLVLFLAQIGLAIGTFVPLLPDADLIVTASADEENVIRLVRITRWWSSNGFYAYGPLYFRLAATLAPVLEAVTSLSSQEAAYLAALAVNVLSLAAVALAPALVLASGAVLRLIGANLLFAALTLQRDWGAWTATAHPDLLLCALTASAAAVLWRAQTTFSRGIGLAGALVGLSLLTKLSALYVIPALIYWAWRLDGRRGARRFSMGAALAYLIAGFPQSVYVGELLGAVKHQSAFMEGPTWQSTKEWLGLIARQAVPFGPLAFVAIFAQAGAKTWTASARLALVFFSSVGLLVSRRALPPHDHYPLPYVAILGPLLATLPVPRGRALFAGALAVASLAVLYPWKYELGVTVENKRTCLPQARAAKNELVGRRTETTRVYVDPYTFDNLPGVVTSWTADEKLFEGMDLLVLRRDYYARFLHADLSPVHRPDFAGGDASSTQQTYRAFSEATASVRLPGGSAWINRHRNPCGFEIWERQP
jgi:hypothetical protein